MVLQGTKRSASFRMGEYFNTAKTKILPLKSGSDYSCLLMRSNEYKNLFETAEKTIHKRNAININQSVIYHTASSVQ